MADYKGRKVVRSPARKVAGASPTKTKLIKSAIALLDDHFLEEITTDMVLQHSAVSRGSLYHHFEDLSDLMEQALVLKFAGFVDASIEALSKLVNGSHSAEEMFAKLIEASDEIQSPENKSNRYYRARLIGLAEANDRLTGRLAREQKRLTNALVELFTQNQRKGWMNKEFDPRVAAVFIQAYTMGRVIDDVSEEKVNPEAWNAFINRAIRMLFG